MQEIFQFGAFPYLIKNRMFFTRHRRLIQIKKMTCVVGALALPKSMKKGNEVGARAQWVPTEAGTYWSANAQPNMI